MNIQTVSHSSSGFKITTVSGHNLFIPNDIDNNEYKLIHEWIDAGGIVTPYISPSFSTDDERIEHTFSSLQDQDIIILKMLLELHNKFLALNSEAPINIAKFKSTILKPKLP